HHLLASHHLHVTLTTAASARLAQGVPPTPASVTPKALAIIHLAGHTAFVDSIDIAFRCIAIAVAGALCLGVALAPHLRPSKARAARDQTIEPLPSTRASVTPCDASVRIGTRNHGGAARADGLVAQGQAMAQHADVDRRRPPVDDEHRSGDE